MQQKLDQERKVWDVEKVLLDKCRRDNQELNKKLGGSTPPGLAREEGDTAPTPHPQQYYPTPPHQQERQEEQERK